MRFKTEEGQEPEQFPKSFLPITQLRDSASVQGEQRRLRFIRHHRGTKETTTQRDFYMWKNPRFIIARTKLN